MQIVKSYIVDDAGAIKSVVLDYQSFQKIEELLLDEGLAKAMEETEHEEEFDLEQAKIMTGFVGGNKV